MAVETKREPINVLPKEGFDLFRGPAAPAAVDALTVNQQLRDRLATASATTIADAALDAIFKRDQASAGKRSQQTLIGHDFWGESSNPAENQTFQPIQEQTRTIVREALSGMSQEDRECVGMLLSDLAKSLVLDRQNITGIYTEDIPTLVKVALDWAINPQAVDQTHIRIGFGGEEIVNSRIPAYIIPAIRTMESVRRTFQRQENWALKTELHRALQEPAKKEAANVILAGKIRERAAAKGQPMNGLSDFQVLNEVLEPKLLTYPEVKSVLTEVWQETLGRRPDEADLQHRYHFSHKLPTVVLFNANHAAINIDRMDSTRVLAARNNTQRLLAGYISEAHPDLRANFIFQNDLPWEEHDYYTRMLILYASNVIGNHDHKGQLIAQKLKQFGEHHERDKDGRVMGIPASACYAAMHGLFFEDPSKQKNWAERLPRPSVMAILPETPHHVIYHQGPPELVFGACRNIWAENSSTSGFLGWLRERHELARLDFSAIGPAMLADAQAALAKKPRAGLRNILKGTIQKHFSKNQSIRNLLWGFVEETDGNDDQAVAEKWTEFTGNLGESKPQEPPELISQLIDVVSVYQENLRALSESVNTNVKRGNTAALAEISNQVETFGVLNPTDKVGLVTSAGNLPVYYRHKPSDSEIWPALELPSLTRYETRLQEVTGHETKLRGTISAISNGITTKILEPFIAGVETIPTSDSSQEALVLARDFNAPAEELVFGITSASQEISDETVQFIASSYQPAVENLIRTIDQMECEGVAPETLIECLQTDYGTLISFIQDDISQRLGEPTAKYLLAKGFMGLVIDPVGKKILQEINAEVVKATFVLNDYRLLLSDLDPDPQIAEKRYNSIIRKAFSDES